jgi:hypothetical protein
MRRSSHDGARVVPWRKATGGPQFPPCHLDVLRSDPQLSQTVDLTRHVPVLSCCLRALSVGVYAAEDRPLSEATSTGAAEFAANLTIRDAFFDTVFSPTFRVRAGKARVPFSYDRNVLIVSVLFVHVRSCIRRTAHRRG